MQEYNDKRVVTSGRRSMLVMNKMVAGLTNLGVSLMGSRVLSVQGRKSGEWRSNPVNLLVLDGQRYLVAPRGHVQWVRNLRVSGNGTLRVGRRIESFRAEEVLDADKADVIRLYLKKWAWEVGAFFGKDVRADSPVETLLQVAPGVPVFKIHAT
ncbi:nitroreductase family deazaflavin-dependent oxidoreductase [Streptomyces sp. SID13031]|nr:nitroreductase/quinone reductase family protein [Streptomyces sp. SID13031]NEA33181.1 nitroreductase family deazaflavin-dependent oxidoreductase [Streptomyces sp. SID13031]